MITQEAHEGSSFMQVDHENFTFVFYAKEKGFGAILSDQAFSLKRKLCIAI